MNLLLLVQRRFHKNIRNFKIFMMSLIILFLIIYKISRNIKIKQEEINESLIFEHKVKEPIIPLPKNKKHNLDPKKSHRDIKIELKEYIGNEIEDDVRQEFRKDIKNKFKKDIKHKFEKYITDYKEIEPKLPPNVIEMPPADAKPISHEIIYMKNSKNIFLNLANIYRLQKENLYFLLNYPKKNFTDYLSNLYIDKKSTAYMNLIDLNLRQLANLETVIKEISSEASHKELEEYVLKVIKNNQFPKKCNNVDVNIFEFSTFCGFGCQIHHLIYFFSVSLAQGRPFIVNSNNWHGFNSFNDLVEPLSDKCLDLYSSKSIKIDSIPIIKIGQLYNDYLPTTFPIEIKEKIQKFHRNPFLWWTGQIIKYIFRFRQETLEKMHIFDFPRPIVGIHIRRTDKLDSEALKYDIEDYMYWVEMYYKKLSYTQPIKKKNVYLATDEVGLIKELISKYPDYNVFHDEKSTIEANRNRNKKDGIYGILSDVYNLAHTDYLVCTFSSNVCRLAFEWMNGIQVDASENSKSLDEIYYFSRQKQRSFNLISNHINGTDKIDKNYLFNLRHNDWNGYSQIEGLDDGQKHHVPSYKINENWLTHEFKAFKNYHKHNL